MFFLFSKDFAVHGKILIIEMAKNLAVNSSISGATLVLLYIDFF